MIATSLSTAGWAIIVEVGLVLIAILGIAWKGGTLAGELKRGQSAVIGDIATINERLNVLQSQELAKMKEDISSNRVETAHLLGLLTNRSATSTPGTS